MKNTLLYKRLISEENIYMAIYSLESYINNPELLDIEDTKNLRMLRDKYNENKIMGIINEVRVNIEQLVNDSEKFMETKVYFKPKKYEKDTQKIEFRPLHTTNIINCITIVSMLNIIVYENKAVCADCEISKECPKGNNNLCNKLILSSLSRLLPSNFFGNKISTSPDFLYKPWTSQYKEYTSRANELFSQFHSNQEYQYEVDLDLKNFFPSINPEMVFNYILDKLPITFNKDELELIRIVLIKLLFLKIDESQLSNSTKRLYYSGKNIPSKGNCFALGIPQGLPHTYFFANICMIEVAKKFNEIFEGKSLYYVDDSVIFTNSITGTLDDFVDKLNKLNSRIQTINNKYYKEYIGKSYIKLYNESLYDFTSKMNYVIEVHEQGGKSTFSDIVKANTGEIYLKSISREVSKTSFDLNTSYSDQEDIILKKRLSTLTDAIKNEINLLDQEKSIEKDSIIIEQLDSYRKKLIRYKKYFKYRKMILEYRESNNYEDVSKKLIDYLKLVEQSEDGVEKFFSLYSEDILGAMVSFVIKNEKNCFENDVVKKNRTSLIKYLKKLNYQLFKYQNKKTSYIYKTYQVYIEQKEIDDEDIISNYDTLKDKVKHIIPRFNKTHSKYKNQYFEENILKEVNVNFGLMKKIFSQKFCETISLVDANTNEIKRVILNSVFSYAFNVDIDDTFNFAKRENRMMNYSELRILAYIRNRYFNLEEFINHIDKINIPDNQMKIDYNLLEVVKCFRTFVKYPNQIDDLIQVHRYTCDVWKNGSKYLYFYTLHNQEHAVDLIKSSIEIVKTINFIQISQMDYYILFLASYLHDISMVTLPALDKIQMNNVKTNKIYSDFVKDMEKIKLYDSNRVKVLLKKYYKELDCFYENEVRSNHAKDSGKEIRNRVDLNFIETCLKDVVAEVAEAHGYDAVEIYKSKSIASNRLVSKKYMQIILRIADLLDMSSYRVSRPILNNNLSNMSELSSFHWLSHLITEGYEWNVSYIIDNADGETRSYLGNKEILERITLKIKVNMSQLSKEEPKYCENVRFISENLSQCGFELKCGEACKEKHCNFLCKWLTKKNNYLFDEFNALQKYLNDNDDNYFKSEIYVKVEIEDKTGMTAEEFEIINNYISR